jgi:hypothetical protein
MEVMRGSSWTTVNVCWESGVTWEESYEFISLF